MALSASGAVVPSAGNVGSTRFDAVPQISSWTARICGLGTAHAQDVVSAPNSISAGGSTGPAANTSAPGIENTTGDATAAPGVAAPVDATNEAATTSPVAEEEWRIVDRPTSTVSKPALANTAKKPSVVKTSPRAVAIRRTAPQKSTPQGSTGKKTVAPRPSAPRTSARATSPVARRVGAKVVLPKVTPLRKSAPVSKVRQAQAWPFVERAVKALKGGKNAQALSLYQRAYQTDPNNIYAINGVADTSLILRRYAQAETAYRRVLGYTPGDRKALRNLGEIYVARKNYPAAESVFRQLLTKTPRDFTVNYRLAQILTWTQRTEQSFPYYRAALSAQPNNAQIWTEWGEALTYTERGAKARAALNRALQLQPNSTRARLALGNLLLWNADYPNAIGAYKQVLARDAKNVTAQIGIGDALTYSQQPANAAPYYQAALRLSPNSFPARLGLGRALVFAQRFEQALPELQAARRAEPNNLEALRLFAVAQAGRDGSPAANNNAALLTYRAVLARQSSPLDQAQTLASIADLENQNGNITGARTAYERALNLSPQNVELSNGFAQLLLGQGEFEAARGVIDAALRRSPENTRARILQVVIENRLGNNERAVALARRLEAVEPATPQDALQLANALRDAGNEAASKRVIERLAATLPTDPSVALQIANAVRDAGDFPAAGALYSRLIQNNPNNLQARLNLAEVLIWQQQLPSAQTQIDYVLTREPDNVEARIKRATLLLRQQSPENLNRAESELAAILKSNPQNAQALATSGELLSLRQKFGDAVGRFRSVLGAEPNNLEARLGLARNLYYARQTEEAIAEYQGLLRLSPNDNQVKLELAQIYLDRNRLTDAEALFNQVAAARSNILPPLVNGDPTFRPNASVAPALAAPFRKSAKSLRSQRAPQAHLQVLADTGKASAGRKINARPQTTRNTRLAQATAPDTTQAAGTTGVGGDVNASDTNSASTGGTAPNGDASTSTPSADAPPATPETAAPIAPDTNLPVTDAANGTPADIQLPPISPVPPTVQAGSDIQQVVALRGLGEVRRRQNRFAEAIEFFERALGLDSSDAPSRLGLAQSLRGQDEFVRALQEAERVLGVEPNNLQARVLKAQLLGDTGRATEAQAELESLTSSLESAQPTVEDYQVLAGAFTGLQNYDAALQLLEAGRADYPNEAILQRATAETLTYARRFPQAVAAYDALLALDANDTDAALGRARVFNYSDDLPQAEAAYRRLLEVEPSNYQGLVELGDVLSRRSNFAEAITLYRTAIERSPNDLQPRLELARVLRYNSNFDEAETTLNDVLAIDARYAPALVERGILRGGRGDTTNGLADLNRALEIAPNDLNAQFGLAEVQSYARQYDQSIAGYQAALKRDPQNVKGRTELGQVLSYAGRYEEALRELNAVVAIAPQNTGALIARADVLARSNRVNEAIAAYNAILATDNRNIRAQQGLAEAFTYGRRYDDSIRVYDALIANAPNDSNAFRLARARTLGFAGRYDQAIRSLRPIVNADADNLEARLTLAEVLTNSGRTAGRREAINIYRGVLQTAPQNVPARIGLGRVLSYDGRYAEARSQLNQVLQTAPQNQEALYALAETQRFAGNYFDSRDVYNRVLRLDPTNTQAREGLALATRQVRSNVTIAGRRYSDSNGVRVSGIVVGPTFVTRAGTIGLTYESGTFRDDAVSLRRKAVNLLLARQIGPIAARLVLTRLKYDGAPDKTLYDLTLGRTVGPRTRYFVGASKLDVFESAGAVAAGITAQQYRAGVDFPIARKIDLEARIAKYRYSDSNSRTTLGASAYYRFKENTPTLRVGVGYVRDNTRFFSPLYYTPQDYDSISLLADYVVSSGRLRYGLFAQHPLTNSSGTGNQNRPADTLFGSLNYDASELVELFLNGGIVRSDNFDSNDITAGATVRF